MTEIVHLKTSRDYIEVQQCDLDFEEELRAAYAINGPVVSIIAEFREEHTRTTDAELERALEALDRLVGFLGQRRITISADGELLDKALVLGDARETRAALDTPSEGEG